MKNIIINLAVAMSCIWGHSAVASCITNNTDAALIAGQYSLISDEDVFRVEPGERVCRSHSGMFYKYDVALIPYNNDKNIYRFYLNGDKDEIYISGHCSQTDGNKCLKQLIFGRGQLPTKQRAEIASDKQRF